MSNLTTVINESFTQYAGAVLQSRALVDVRDCFKPSARQVFYCMFTDKFTHDKPFKKTLKAVGSAMRMYIHGDSSCEGIIMRAGQPFAMRYPIIEVEGSYGNLMESGNWAAPRYTSARLSDLANYLFKDIQKDTIKEWRDNYDDTEKYPAVLPTKGFYNIVNGGTGIGVGAAFNCPQFNLKEVNNALIKLLWNPDADFEDIYCAPDFATGAILLNEEQVKESLKNGYGFACKLRSVIDFDSNERCLIVTEIPYGVYTNTICKELEAILQDDSNPGIDRFNDLTSSTPLIKIYLSKKANPDKVIKYLYKNTSLQSYFSINLTMLDDGRYPKVYGWKQALQEHINHELTVYHRSFEYDLEKIKARLHIIEGLMIALANIEEVVKIIKTSKNSSSAAIELQKKFLLSEKQTKAILDMKLSRLAHLEVAKLEKEQTDLKNEADRLENILNNETLLKKEVQKGFEIVSEKFSDARRTKILNIENEEDEPLEIKTAQLSLTNKGNIFLNETSSLYTQRRGGVGNKLKLDKDEYIISTTTIENIDNVLFFTDSGHYFSCNAQLIPFNEKVYIGSIISIDDENICAVSSISKNQEKEFIIFITRNGLIKKTKLTEYNTNRSGRIKAISLDEDDKIINVVFTNEENIGLLTKNGNFLIIESKDIRPIGRVTRGIKGIKLNEGDYLVSGKIIPKDTKMITSISKAGLFKRTPIEEFYVQGKNTKGAKLQKINEDDYMADFTPISVIDNIFIASCKSCIKISINDVPILSKGALGNKSIKLKNNDYIISISKI